MTTVFLHIGCGFLKEVVLVKVKKMRLETVSDPKMHHLVNFYCGGGGLLLLISHSVEITETFCHTDFT